MYKHLVILYTGDGYASIVFKLKNLLYPNRMSKMRSLLQ